MSDGEEIEIDEGNIGAIGGVPRGSETISLSNKAGIEVDEAELIEGLKRLRGIGSVKSLVIEASSRLQDVRLVAALPALETLQVFGLHLRSLEGIEAHQTYRFIDIDTGRNRVRDIGRLVDADVSRLWLRWAQATDLDAVGRNSTINDLVLRGCPELPFGQITRTPIEKLGLNDCSTVELDDSALLPRLRTLSLARCTKLQRFGGNHGGVEWLLIQACNKLDFSTVKSFANLQHLALLSVKPELRLSWFATMPRLRNLSLQDCKVALDVTALKAAAPDLEKIAITRLKQEEVLQLSRDNRGVLVSSGPWSYRDGAPATARG